MMMTFKVQMEERSVSKLQRQTLCPECSNGYCSGRRPKVELCAKGHAVCYQCLESREDGFEGCRICNIRCSLSLLTKQQNIFRSVCPYFHFSKKLRYSSSFCSNCCQEGNITSVCNECNYSICSSCHFLYHETKCKQTERQFFSDLQYGGQCGVCKKLQQEVGCRCLRCGVIFCFSCMKAKKAGVLLFK